MSNKRKKQLKKRKHLYEVAIRIFVTLVLLVALVIEYRLYKTQQDTQKEKEIFKNQYYTEDAFVRPTFLPTPTSGETPAPEPVKIPVVMYHYVEYVQDRNDTTRIGLNVTPAEFEKHLKSFREENIETYFVRDIPDILSGKVDYQPDRSVILSFDDGYEDFYTEVFPLLKKYHMRATLYVIYDFIGRKGFVTKTQVQELIDSGLVEIGSHTFDHLYLKTVADPVARWQIINSKGEFEKEFHTKIYTFAYPYGAMSPQAIQYAKDAGYTAAVSVIPGVKQSEENLFFLSRIRPGIFSSSAALTILNLKK